MLQKLVSLTVFVFASVYCAVLEKLLLFNKTAKAGIATLTFNSTSINLPDIPLAKLRAISIPNFFQPLKNKAQNAANVLATTIATAASNAQSAASFVATAVIDA
ncbi:hypothetical protein B0O99DRAFT_696763 [Bisporella sp. PMI_857]|nr:hypothetical protein B0O99DRAFT_696763 [Bisporella sp. PMI_857]